MPKVTEDNWTIDLRGFAKAQDDNECWICGKKHVGFEVDEETEISGPIFCSDCRASKGNVEKGD